MNYDKYEREIRQTFQDSGINVGDTEEEIIIDFLAGRSRGYYERRKVAEHFKCVLIRKILRRFRDYRHCYIGS